MFGLGRFTQAAQGFMGGGPSSNTFEQRYTVLPVSFAGKDQLEKGNKVILPPSALDTLARLEISWPMLFRFKNEEKGRETCGGVMEFVAEEGTCYMPYWMMQNLLLKEHDIVKVNSATLPKGRYVKLRPVTKDFLEISNPRAVLEASLRHYATLTVGDNISISYNDKKYEIEIAECKPAQSVSVIETDVEVDFAPPKDYVEPEVPRPQEESSSAAAASPGAQENDDSIPTSSVPEVFSGTGVRLDGKPVRDGGGASASSPPNFAAMEEEDDLDENPWMKALPGGVRTQNKEFDEMMREGKIPGRGRGKVDPKSTQRDDLFTGHGRTYGK